MGWVPIAKPVSLVNHELPNFRVADGGLLLEVGILHVEWLVGVIVIRLVKAQLACIESATDGVDSQQPRRGSCSSDSTA